MDDLVRWLGEQLDEDEADVRRGYLKAEPLPDYDGWDKSTTAGLPPVVAARVLREIDAKRQLVEQHRPVGYGDVCLSYCRTRTPSQPQAWPCLTLRLLALPYADRPGYQESWRP